MSASATSSSGPSSEASSGPAKSLAPILERYQRYLFYYRKQNGEPLSVGA
jgi:hypothetical protein